VAHYSLVARDHRACVRRMELFSESLEASRGSCYAWGMPKRSSKPPFDPNRAAKSILDRIAGEATPEPEKNPAAQALGRLGGLKGGKARAASMTPEQRKEVAKKAAEARWGKKP